MTAYQWNVGNPGGGTAPSPNKRTITPVKRTQQHKCNSPDTRERGGNRSCFPRAAHSVVETGEGDAEQDRRQSSNSHVFTFTAKMTKLKKKKQQKGKKYIYILNIKEK